MFPAIIIGLVSYHLITKMVINNTTDEYKETLERTVNSIDEKIASINNYGLSLSQTNWVQSFMLHPLEFNPNLADLNNYDYQLQLFSTSNDLVDATAIYIRDSDLILSSSGHSGLDWFLEEAFQSGQLNKQTLEAKIKDGTKQLIRAEVTLYSREKSGFIYLVPLAHAFNNNDTRGVLITFISDASISNLFDNYGKQKIGVELKYSSSSEANTSNNYTISLNNNHLEEKLDYNYSLQKKVSRVPWTVKMLIPEVQLAKSINGIRIISFASILLLLLLGCAVSYFLMKKNYQPLSKLMELFAYPHGKRNEDQNEYEWLAGSINSLMNKEQEIKKQLQDQKPLLKEVYLKKMISENEVFNPKTRKALEFLDITFPYPSIQCAILFGKEIKPEMIKKITSSITNQHENKIYTIKQHDHWIMILNKNKIEQDLFDEMSKHLHCYPAVFTLGVGRTYQELADIRRSFNEANIAADYRLLKGNERLIMFDQIKKANQYYYYPIEQEYQITSLLKSGNHEKAIQIFEILLQKNLTRNISSETLRNFALDAQLTALKLLQNEQEFYTDEYENIQQIIDTIAKTYEYVANLMEKQTSAHHKNILEEMINYIDKNLNKQTLSLNEIADSFGYSTSYVSKMFKEHIGCNYLTYLHKERIDMAKKILILNRFDIKTIANQVGFESDTTFRRIFKKYEGLTPTQYKSVKIQSEIKK